MGCFLESFLDISDEGRRFRITVKTEGKFMFFMLRANFLGYFFDAFLRPKFYMLSGSILVTFWLHFGSFLGAKMLLKSDLKKKSVPRAIQERPKSGAGAFQRQVQFRVLTNAVLVHFKFSKSLSVSGKFVREQSS